jgi:adenine phosphoribosyltransferase
MNHPFHSLINNVPDFPKAGIIFKDIGPLLKDHFPEVIAEMGKKINWNEIDYIVGIESRGFILGCGLSQNFKKGFIPVRKKGKLPPPTISESYALEYGTDTLEMQINSKKSRVVIVDDVLATGGTLNAVLNLCKKNNFEVKAVSMLINLSFLNNFKNSNVPVFSVLEY